MLKFYLNPMLAVKVQTSLQLIFPRTFTSVMPMDDYIAADENGDVKSNGEFELDSFKKDNFSLFGPVMKPEKRLKVIKYLKQFPSDLYDPPIPVDSGFFQNEKYGRHSKWCWKFHKENEILFGLKLNPEKVIDNRMGDVLKRKKELKERRHMLYYSKKMKEKMWQHKLEIFRNKEMYLNLLPQRLKTECENDLELLVTLVGLSKKVRSPIEKSSTEPATAFSILTLFPGVRLLTEAENHLNLKNNLRGDLPSPLETELENLHQLEISRPVHRFNLEKMYKEINFIEEEESD